MDLLQRMRIVGSGLVIAAYFITLHLDVVTGVIVHLTTMSISVPYFIKSKALDVVGKQISHVDMTSTRERWELSLIIFS